MQKGDETNSYKCLDSASIKQQKKISKNLFFSKTLWSALSLMLQKKQPCIYAPLCENLHSVYS